ncbi:MAG: trypsin-like serine protease [Dysgonamonadaceae bacterium]|nr:trypsin-like serine protease [Dysgonamonadaceae bacterium]
MPAFDLDSVLSSDEVTGRDSWRGYQFAHKFYTHIEKGKDGIETILDDGTKVWQVGIRSRGAYSINLLFTQFTLPQGGRLFIYNEDRSHVIGAFDYRNNSPGKILPVQPVAGEAIIVEYSEPADAEFEGKLKIGEVNHDYRDLLRSREPGDQEFNEAKYFLCMPDVLCSEGDEALIRATVLLVIDGYYTCTGTLINNTENDETPYVLTAVHCLNGDLEKGIYKGMDHYVTQAGTVIAFFNYNRPVCGSNMKGTEEMSIAVAQPKVIIEKKDIALLEFHEKPPVYYNAYYAGWSIDTDKYMPPYTSMHHPAASTKRYGLFAGNPELVSFKNNLFDRSTHLKISSWNIGSTHGGSSGSPLFDSNQFLVGSLSGGSSACTGTNPNGMSDFYAAFFKGWENEDESNQLKTYLDPNGKGTKQLDGFDPYLENPFIRVSNADYNKAGGLLATQYTDTLTNGLFLFGNSKRNIVEFAEEFNLKSKSDLYGVYFFMPNMPSSYASNVKIEVYSGTQSPEKLIAEKAFLPKYYGYTSNNFSFKDITTNSYPTEHFVAFDNPVRVGEKFFIAYKIEYSNTKKFVIHNIKLGEEESNTAWIKTEQGVWTPASNYSQQPVATSLAIQPLLRYNDGTFIPTVKAGNENTLQYLREENTLILSGKLPEAGFLQVYSVSGQIIQKVTLRKGQNSVVLKPQNSGTIGIVRILRGNEAYSGKILY